MKRSVNSLALAVVVIAAVQAIYHDHQFREETVVARQALRDAPGSTEAFDQLRDAAPDAGMAVPDAVPVRVQAGGDQPLFDGLRDLLGRGSYSGQAPLEEVPQEGHGKTNPDPYNIWTQNCHTAANKFVCSISDKSKVGIIACGGNPTEEPAYHTVNWIVLSKGQTCVYGWGRSCCWDATTIPPDISSGEGKRCARSACGKQYCSGTRCLAPGQFVEWPDAGTCSLIAAGGKPDHPEYLELDFSPDRGTQCLKCCDDRAALWSWGKWSSASKAQFEEQRQDFRVKCGNGCRNIFR